MARRYSVLKVDKLENRYPFLEQIWKMNLQPSASLENCKPDVVRISVQTADETFMYHKPVVRRFCDIFERGRRGKPARAINQCEYVFAAGATDIITGRRWAQNRQELEASGDFFARDILMSPETGYPIWNETKYLIWVTVTAYHEDTKIANKRFGKVIDRIVDVIIYEAPESGFERLYKESPPEEHVYLNEYIYSRALIEDNRVILGLGREISELCTRFQETVYRNGLKAILDSKFECGFCGKMSGQYDQIRMTYYTDAGRRKLLVEDSMTWIIFGITDKGENLVVASMSGTVSQLRSLIESVVERWSSDPINIKPDR